MKENVRLGRIAGVAVGFNWTLLLVAGFLAIGLGGSRFPLDAPGYSRLVYAVAGGVTAVAFLAGVLAHEMSHALVARHEGLAVDGIVLWLMGGYTRISEDPQTPGAELRISAVGPLVSLLIGAGCLAAALVCETAGISRLAGSVLRWLGAINVLLAFFNMLPGTPLDGGRVLHAAVWGWTGDKYRAARTAGRAGWLIGAALVGAAVALVISGLTSILDGAWLGIVGWFLMMASRSEQGAATMLQSLEGLRARDIMAVPGVAPGWLTVDAFLREYGGDGRPSAYLVEQWGGGLAGLAPTSRLERVTREQAGVVRAVDYALAIPDLPVFGPEQAAADVARQMTQRNASWSLVVAADRIVGVVSLAAMAGSARRAAAAVPVG